ncbi:hypothetical protein [Mycetohabitans sp. B46]|uniref:hypothetical protein n=1 Tax=Mycetohabitans sp. B46 TaxID=2772536 RepID=UPI00307CDC3C
MKPQISQNFSNAIHRLISPANTSTQSNGAPDRRAAEPSTIDTGKFRGLFSRKPLSKEERDALDKKKVDKEWPKIKKELAKSNKSQRLEMEKNKEKKEKCLIAIYNEFYDRKALMKKNPPKTYNMKTLDGVEPPLTNLANVPKEVIRLVFPDQN